MTQDEVKRVLDQMNGTHALMAKILYGGCLRLMECVRLRVQDLDLERRKIYVNSVKDGKDRITLFPSYIYEDMNIQLSRVKTLHEEDL